MQWLITAMHYAGEAVDLYYSPKPPSPQQQQLPPEQPQPPRLPAKRPQQPPSQRPPTQ